MEPHPAVDQISDTTNIARKAVGLVSSEGLVPVRLFIRFVIMPSDDSMVVIRPQTATVETK